ncbi:MAG TPA: zinc ribbon domain-containing protein [Candidatus Dormibacteraeota bacterium]|nr:zinc ribbon domain-containing protein [Candidatus Dormibacteraeota bacterium]
MAERRPNRALGGPHDTFWAHCANGELRLQRCGACGHVSWPPVNACEECGDTGLTWERMSGRGRVIGWNTFHQRYYKELEPPYDTLLVELEEGPLFIGNPLGFSNDEVRFEMPVQVAFLDCEDDAGAFRLPVFERG